MDPSVIKFIVAGLCTVLAGMVPAWGEASISMKALDGMARNPEVADKLATNAIVLCAVVESTAIYGLVISLIILFAA